MGCCALPVRFATPLFYLVGFLATSAISWCLRDYGSSVLNFSPVNDCLDGVEPDAEACLGNSAVLRISFGSCLFFAAHALLLIGVTTRSNPRLAVHNGLWPLQLLAWGGLVGATFAMPNSVFPVWGQIARVLSTFFILLQVGRGGRGRAVGPQGGRPLRWLPSQPASQPAVEADSNL